MGRGEIQGKNQDRNLYFCLTSISAPLSFPKVLTSASQKWACTLLCVGMRINGTTREKINVSMNNLYKRGDLVAIIAATVQEKTLSCAVFTKVYPEVIPPASVRALPSNRGLWGLQCTRVPFQPCLLLHNSPAETKCSMKATVFLQCLSIKPG